MLFRSGPETLAEAARRLYHVLLRSKSSRAVLRAAQDRLDLHPGANGTGRVMGVCMPSGKPEEESLFLHNQQPDTVISIFNSPFGPDVLIVTDKLSEGIDLHRYCRHLIHYELDPSPIRTVQRIGHIMSDNSLRRCDTGIDAQLRQSLTTRRTTRGVQCRMQHQTLRSNGFDQAAPHLAAGSGNHDLQRHAYLLQNWITVAWRHTAFAQGLLGMVYLESAAGVTSPSMRLSRPSSKKITMRRCSISLELARCLRNM